MTPNSKINLQSQNYKIVPTYLVSGFQVSTRAKNYHCDPFRVIWSPKISASASKLVVKEVHWVEVTSFLIHPFKQLVRSFLAYSRDVVFLI